MENDIKVKKLDKISAYMVGAWISLPIIMLICHFVQGARGRFPTKEEIEAAGLTYGYVTYNYTTSTFQLLFHILGVITILYTIYLLFSAKKNLFSMKAAKEKKWFYYLIYLITFAIITAIFSDNLAYSFVGEDYLCDGLSSYFIYAAVFVLAYSVQSEEYKINIIRYFVGMMTLMCILMLIAATHTIEFFDYIFPTKFALIWNQFNHFGYMLCMTVCAFTGLFLYDPIEKKWVRILYFLGIILSYASLVVNTTFGAWLATIIALPIIYVAYHFSEKPKRIDFRLAIVVYILMIVTGIVFSSDLLTSITTTVSDVGNIAANNEESATAGTGRWTLWKDTVQRILKRPVFGYGPEGLYGDNAITNGDSPHNEYLQIAAFMGIPGLILYITALVLLFKHHILNLKNLSPAVLIATSVMGGYLISAFFGNPVFNTYPYFWMYYGISSSYGLEDLKKETKAKRRKKSIRALD